MGADNRNITINGNPVKCIIFDGDGVIIDIKKNMQKALEAVLLPLDSKWQNMVKPVIRFILKFAIFVNNIGVLKASEEKLKLLITFFSLLLFKNPAKFTTTFFEEYEKLDVYITEGNLSTYDLICKLKKRGYIVVGCSNNFQNAIIFRETMEEENIFVSGSIGGQLSRKKMKKPGLYGKMLLKKQILYSNCVIVGDSYRDDILAGKKYGVSTIFFSRTLPRNIMLLAKPAYACKSLQELYDVFEIS